EYVPVARVRQVPDPLLRSGFVLAGANASLRSGTLPSEVDDGWVTAAEVAETDLRGTEVVFLSACETGLGDVSAGEGVYGLRRSVFLAGARSLVAALYSVPTEQTLALSSGFYSGLSRGLGRGAALRQAQLGQLARDRRQQASGGPAWGQYPWRWAG